MEGIRTDFITDFINRHFCRDQFHAPGGVNSIEAGMRNRRRSDAHMHLSRAIVLKHRNDSPACDTANDRIIHQHHTFAFHGFAHHTQFHFHPTAAKFLVGLDEGSADVSVFHHPQFIGKSALLSIANRRGQT